jgi:hypothetical protein
MLPTTMDIIRSGLKADPTLTPADRAKLLTLLRAGPNPPGTQTADARQPQLIRRDEAARRLACSPRTVDKLGANGVLRRVILPGRQRAAGFLEGDITSLITGR